jgi:hypothetical protein
VHADLEGVKPRIWWKAEQARKATRRAVAIWASLLIVLIIILLIAQPTR